MMWQECFDIIKRGELSLDGPLFSMMLKPAKEGREISEPKHCMILHFAMWLHANPHVTEFKIMADGILNESPIVQIRACPLWVFFGKKSDLTAFAEWLQRYKTWFDGNSIDQNMIPQFPLHGTHTVSVVEVDLAGDPLVGGYPDGLFERWAWIVANCVSPVYMMPYRGFAFTDDREGMMYKLRWR